MQVGSTTELTDTFEVIAPAMWHLPVVFNSPHSGSYLPSDIVSSSRISPAQLRLSEDLGVDQLFSGCVNSGIPLLRAQVSRAWVDLNREPYELDPRMFHEGLPGYMNVASPRVAAGFGTIPRCVGDGLEIYRGKLSLALALQRIESCYHPYHRTLKALLNEAWAANGFVLLIDCHSMPTVESARGRRPDIVLGDRFGAACVSAISRHATAFFESRGLHVAHNKPYAGGFITETYGAPHQNRHALQIEVSRHLYMNEASQTLHGGFGKLKSVLDDFANDMPLLLKSLRPATPFQRAAE